MNHIGNKVRYYRELNGIKQSELADMLGYKDRSSIGKIENGINDIPLSMLEKIAKVFGISPVDLYDSAETLSLHEQIVIDKYRQLDEAEKNVIDKILGIEKKSSAVAFQSRERS